MRSFLFVPGDSSRKFAKACLSPADALILDLEDSVAHSAKAEARRCTASMLDAPRSTPQARFVRINALDTGLSLDDLVAIMPHKPDGIVLPKCESPADLQQLGHYLAALEAAHGLAPTPIITIVTETAASLFNLGNYKNVEARLWGMMWGAEDLATSLGARENSANGIYHEPFRLARQLCLAGAAAADVVAIDSICAALDDMSLIAKEASEARRDGFGAKAVIHPKHLEAVNQAFTPTEAEIRWAKTVLAAFADAGDAGVVRLDGKMLDKPHEKAARKLLDAVRS